MNRSGIGKIEQLFCKVKILDRMYVRKQTNVRENSKVENSGVTAAMLGTGR